MPNALRIRPCSTGSWQTISGIGANGQTPGKAQLLKNWRSQSGQAPPYTVETSDMRVFVLGEAAVASYTKTYTAKENGNIAHEDVTDVLEDPVPGSCVYHVPALTDVTPLARVILPPRFPDYAPKHTCVKSHSALPGSVKLLCYLALRSK